MSSHPTSLYSGDRALALLQAHPNTHQVCLPAGDASVIIHAATSVRQQRHKATLECRTAGPASRQLPIAFRYFPIQRPCSNDRPTGKLSDVSLFHRCMSHLAGQLLTHEGPLLAHSVVNRTSGCRLNNRIWFNRLTPTGAGPSRCQSVRLVMTKHETYCQAMTQERYSCKGACAYANDFTA